MGFAIAYISKMITDCLVLSYFSLTKKIV